MDAISNLRTILDSVWNGQHVHFSEQDLIDHLLANKPRLLQLLDVGSRNQNEQRDIQNGRINVDGKSIVIDSEFAQLVNFLAQHLECSERYIAGLLLKLPSSLPVDQRLEAVITLYHSERTILLDCVDLLLALTLTFEQRAASSPLIARVASFVRNHLLSPTVAPSGWVKLVFLEIENVWNTINRVSQAARNAPSATVPPSVSGNATFGSEILTERISALEAEQRRLGGFFVSLARLGAFRSVDIKVSLDWLTQRHNRPSTYAVLSAMLYALDPEDPDTPSGQTRQSLASDADLVQYMAKKLSPSAQDWTDQGLKSVILLKWTLFQIEAREVDPALEVKEGFAPDDLETQLSNGVQGDAFVYLSRSILHIRSSGATLGLSPLILLPPLPETEAQPGLPMGDFTTVVLTSFEILIRSLIFFATPELRRIRQRQEDVVLAAARNAAHPGRFPGRSVRHTVQEKQTPRNDIVVFFSLVGLIYSSLGPEHALQFWGSGPPDSQATYLQLVESRLGRLPAFLQWAVWSTQPQHPDQVTALYNMLGGLSKGRHCSELAYNFMAGGGGEVIPGSSVASGSQGNSSASWNFLFSTLASFANPASRSSSYPPGSSMGLSTSHQQGPPNVLTQDHVLLGRSFLVLLSTTVSYSIAVRKALFGNTQFRPVTSLANLISLGIPLELKGAIFDTLAAFAEPGAGAEGLEMCRSVWTTLEKLEAINVRPMPSGFGAFSPLKGVQAELEQVESVNRIYPVTIPFLRLMCTLLHTPKRISLRDREDASLSTIPESLGQPYRLPGIGPYISFVLDTVLAQLGNLEFNSPSDQWEMMGLCLCFVERALASYQLEEMTTLVSRGSTPQARRDAILPFLVHPGYDIMTRLLSETPLLQTLLSSLGEGIRSFDRGNISTNPSFISTITRLLRIVHRTLEIQDHFLDMLVPLVVEVDTNAVLVAARPRSFYTRFDQSLSFGADYVPAIAAYTSVGESSSTELGLLSVKILALLSASPISSNITALVERSDLCFRILDGFCNLLSVESLDEPNDASLLAEESTGAGAGDVQINLPFPQAIRVAILDLFIRNTKPAIRVPTFPHFLFFGEKDQWSPRSCGRIILRLLNEGIPILDDSQEQPSPGVLPLFIRQPTLAERCYRIIHQLCVHPKTPAFLMRDLRTEDFFARHLYAVPIVAPSVESDAFIEVVFSDGSRVVSTATSFASFLKLRSWILDLVALDLHFLTNERFGAKVSNLLNILLGTASEAGESWGQGFKELGQSRMRIIEFVQSLTFDWADSLTVAPVELQFFGNLDLSMCTTTDESGGEIVDRAALLSLLASAKRSLQMEGRVTTDAHHEELETERAYIIQSCTVENNRRAIVQATTLAYEAWRRLLDITLTKCFSRLPSQSRENVLYDLLHTLPPIIAAQETEEPTAVLLSETLLSVMTKLREDRRQQSFLQASGLPSERLQVILRGILPCVLESNRAEQVRGNLYAVLINIFHLVSSPTSISNEQTSKTSQPFGQLDLSSLPKRTSMSSLLTGSFSLVKSVLDKLTLTVARDAIDGTEVWRTVAFMLLDALVRLSAFDRQHPILNNLVRQGILDNFVRGLKDSDERLQSVLRRDPDDLNPLYIFESKMSFFIALAQTRVGAERLLEARIIPTLAHCDFLDARPDVDQSFIDHDSFLPSAVQRYHQLFLPSIQVIDAILTTLGEQHTTAANQALEFLRSHSATISIMLKESSTAATLAVLEELQLILTLCAASIAQVPKTELLSPTSSFGSIHSTILSLSSKFLSNRNWLRDVRPQSDAEVINASLLNPSQGELSRFDQAILKIERLLVSSLVHYIGSASDFTGPQINLVLSPIVTVARHGERGSNYLASIPSVGDIMETLDNLCVDLMETLTHIQTLSAEIQSKEQINTEVHSQVLTRLDASLFHQFDIGQRREIIAEEFSRIREEELDSAKSLLSSIEMALLLVWRHVAYYAEERRHQDSSKLKASMAHSMRLLANTDPETFKSEVAARLLPVLQRLQAIQSKDAWAEWKPDVGYVEVMTRRLKDIAGYESDEEDFVVVED